jgi:hypothetical protein
MSGRFVTFDKTNSVKARQKYFGTSKHTHTHTQHIVPLDQLLVHQEEAHSMNQSVLVEFCESGLSKHGFVGYSILITERRHFMAGIPNLLNSLLRQDDEYGGIKEVEES